MIQNLLFSLNVSLPLFVIMGLGQVLTKKGLFTGDYISRTTKLVYYVLLPAKLFMDISSTDLSTAFSPRYFAVVAVGLVLQFLVAWSCGDLLCRDRSKQGAFSHACFRGNFVYLGMALLQDIYGGSVPETALILAVVMPLYNVQGIILLSVKEKRGKIDLRSVLLDILKNPMILALLAGLPVAILQIHLPYVVTKSLSYLQVATSTLALLVVGANIRPAAIRSDFPLLLKISAVKLLLMPLIWGVMSVLAGLTPAQTVVLTIVGAMPSTINVFVITDRMGGDGALACGAVVVTHVLSLFTMTGIVFLFRSIGFI